MRRLLPLLMICAVLFGSALAVRSLNETPVAADHSLFERTDGTYLSIVDEAGAVLHMTGHMLEPGDEWVTHDDRRFEITRVEADIAYSRFIGIYRDEEQAPASMTQWERLVSLLIPFEAAQARQGGEIAVYHTHSDESYIPSEGTHSVSGKGGIYRVGETLRQALERTGTRVTHDQSIHLPHDAGAYNRSRRTASALMRWRPRALLDVHRDAAPQQAYAAQAAGTNVTQIMAVIGRGNPKWQSNAAFARSLKAEINRDNPGLFKGIIFRGGSFNQDLYDRAVLLEVGAHTNSRQEAERSMELAAPAIARAAGTAAGAQPGTRSAQGRGSWSALGWLLGLTILGIVGYMFVSTGSFEEAMQKLRRFGREDLAGFLGWQKRPERNCPEQPEGEPLRAPEHKWSPGGGDTTQKAAGGESPDGRKAQGDINSNANKRSER